MVAEEVIIALSGGAPWGFRLQGGVEHQKPLQVAKVRKRSKACRAGLREADELMFINESPCGGLSHAQAMTLIDSSPGILHIRVKRAPAGFQTVVLFARAPSPRIDKEYRAALRAMSPLGSRPQQPSVRQVHHGSLMSRSSSGLTSPPGSEAYYGETDSDADVTAHERQRRQKRRSPSSSPGKVGGRASPEGGETSEMSGYDSAPDAQGYSLIGLDGRGEALPGVARKEVIYQRPLPGAWSSQTSTETSSISADDQGPRDGVMEEDSGFQEHSNVPLVSPERARGAMLLGSRAQLVPMVGPVGTPVAVELTMTYMDKAKQAKLNRGDTAQDKQVKEARTKCRTIASLLTDAPNPHSKGVLMFKKRRQRSKKYTLTSFGSVDEDTQDSQEDEDAVFPGSESEFDEDGFAAAPDPTWDGDYLNVLEKRSAGAEDAPSPGLSDTSGRGARLFEQQRKRAAEHAKKTTAMQVQMQMQVLPEPQTLTQSLPELSPLPELQQQTQPQIQPPLQPPLVAPKPVQQQQQEALATEVIPILAPAPSAPSHPAIQNRGAVMAVSAASVVMPPPAVAPMTTPVTTLMGPPQTPLPELPSSSVLNRTARPFAPGFISHRVSTTPVVFRPDATKWAPRPVSVAVAALPFSTAPEERALDVAPASFAPLMSASQPTASAPTAAVSPPSSVSTGPFSAHSTVPATPRPLPHLVSSLDNIQAASQLPSVPRPTVTAIPSVPAVAAVTHSAPATPMSPVARERAQATSSRTGFLQDARRRSAHRPMFKLPHDKKNSPNPDLLSMVQNLDERPRYRPAEPVGFESGAEGDSYNLGTDYTQRGKVPPPVAPKPRVIPEVSQIPQAEGKGAALFARRQSRMDQYVVDSPPSTHSHQQYQPQSAMVQPHDTSPTPSAPCQWKYSPNIRAPPPIGYNPLLAPSCPIGPQHGGARGSDGSMGGSRGGYGTRKEGIKVLDFMRRQPYQLNSAMFSSSTQPAAPSYQYQRQQREGHTLIAPRQIPVKSARVYEIKRFSTPTPMSAPTLTPTVIAPRSATTLSLSRSNMISPPLAPLSPPSSATAPAPTPTPATVPMGSLPELPKISATPIRHPTPYSPPVPMSGLTYTGLQASKQFMSAPELSALLPRSPPVQAPKPRFIATRVGVQPRVWRPGALPH